jgi:tetrahydromethanopterin S-methyltransferase subunit G
MRKVILITALFALMLSTTCIHSAFAQQKNETDREQFIRLQEGVNNLSKRTDAGFVDMKEGFADVKQQISQVNSNINTLFGACIGLIGVLIVLLIWDRRTAMQPQTEATKNLKVELDALRNEMQTLKNQLPLKSA